MRRRLLFAAFGALLALTACGGRQAPPAGPVPGADTAATAQANSAAAHQQVVDRYGGAYRDPRLDSYLRGVAERVVAASDVPFVTPRVTVLDSGAVNAHSLPGGYLYLTRGLLAVLGDEAELAAVLAHEIGHLARDHASRRLANRVTTAVAMQLAAAAGDEGDPAEMNRWAAERMAEFSQAQEMEADLLAVDYLTAAGYDPSAVATMLERMGLDRRLSQSDFDAMPGAAPADFARSHPITGDRVRALARTTAPVVDPSARRSEAYLSAVQGMVFGGSASTGFAVGGTYVHPPGGVVLTVPDGFTLTNRGRRLQALGPDGSRLVIMPAAPWSGDFGRYLGTGWRHGLNLGRPGRFPLDEGGEGVVGEGAMDFQGTRFGVRLIAARLATGQVYRFVHLGPAPVSESVGRAVLEAIAGLHRIGATDGLAPARIGLHRVRPGDSVESLVARWPAMSAETFRAVNGLANDSPLLPGTVVKIVER